MRLLNGKIFPLERDAKRSAGPQGKSPPFKKGVPKGRGIFLLVFTFSLLFFSSCKDENEPQPPVINLKTMSADTLVQFQDSLDIIIKYTDMDGDVGESDADTNALYVKDSRLAAADYYHVQPLYPPNTALKTQGEVTIKIPNMFLLGNGGNETAYFTIKLRDHSGHWSNEIITPQIVITQ